MTETMRLGARLRAARKAAGFKTSKAFLKKYKVPASTYSQHESGAREPDDKTMRYYSKVFEINFNWLKLGKGQPFNHSTPSKMNTVKEELFDLTTLKGNEKKMSSQIDKKLLTKIMSNVIDFYTEIESKQLIYAIVRDVVNLYANITGHENDAHKIKKILIEYRNKQTR